MNAALFNRHTEVDDFLGVSNLCRYMIQSVVDNQHGTFMSTGHEPCRENMMSHHGDSDSNVDSARLQYANIFSPFVVM